jgi:pimeloyl-ACP methyl ester carboxylesterase
MTAWVLLRGLGREARHWGNFVTLLQQAVPAGDSVLTLDLPGNGSRWRECSPWSVAAMAESVRAELARRPAAHDCVLVALSLGAMAALQWATIHPRAVRGCVLINSSMGGLSPLWQRLRPAALLQLLLVARPGATALSREQRILRLTSNRDVDPALAAAWVDYARAAPVSGASMLRQLVAAARYRAPAALPPVPLLLLASQRDRLASVRCSRAMARAWGVPLREHPSAGHDLPLDDPSWVVEQIFAWQLALSQ